MEFVDDWMVTQTLGEGSFGEVKLLVNKRTGDTVALKSINLKNTQKLEEHQISADELERMVKKEMTIHVKLNHENIIKFYGSRMELDQHIYMFLEYAQGGELYDRIEPDIGLTPESKIRPYFTQLINGVSYLHSMGIAHRDLKPENILLDSNDTIKISDFGFATLFKFDGKERICEQKCGTAPYVAPEVMSKPTYKPAPTDIWSCGIILVTLLTGELPWDSPTTASSPEFAAWCNGSASSSSHPWNKFDLQTLNLFKRVLSPIPAKRIVIEDLLKHPWVVDNGKAAKESTNKLAPPKIREEASLQNLLNTVAFSQPDPVIAQRNREAAAKDNDVIIGSFFSFSQPAEGTTEDFFLTSSSTSTVLSAPTGNFTSQLVKRMTRFIAKTNKDTTYARITEVLDRNGLNWRPTDCGLGRYAVITISTIDKRKSPLVYKCNIIEMMVDCMTQILVDFRLSRGDGLEFKRHFLKIRGELKDIATLSAPLNWVLSCGTIQS